MDAFLLLADIYIKNIGVISISGNEIQQMSGATFIEKVVAFFAQQGSIAKSPFGDIVLDKRGAKNSKNHGIGVEKAKAFAAVKDVLEQGSVQVPMGQYKTNPNKKLLTGMIVANIQISGNAYTCVVEVCRNADGLNRLYNHEVTPLGTQKPQDVVATSRVSGGDAAPRQHQGEMAKVTKDFQSNNKETNESKNMKKNTIKLNESQLRKVIAESIQQTLNEYNYADAAYDYMWGPGSDERFGYEPSKERSGHLHNLVGDKYRRKQNWGEILSGEKYYVFTGTTRHGYERHWVHTDEENEQLFGDTPWYKFYGINKDSIGKIAGPFSYRMAGWDYCKKHNINTPKPGENVESEWSPEKKAEQEKVRKEHKYYGALINAATTAMANIVNPQIQKNAGIFAPPGKIKINEHEVANGMKKYVREPELINMIDTYLKNGKEELVNRAILSAFSGIKRQLGEIQGGNGMEYNCTY